MATCSVVCGICGIGNLPLDPTSMENKKGAYANSGSTPTSEALVNEAIPKHVHQHNTAPQHLRLLQYGLKIPSHQHSQLNQPSPHQHQPPPVTPHVHQHQHQSQSTYQPPPLHQHLQPSHQHQSNTPNVYQNQMVHHPQFAHQHQQKHQSQQNQTSQNHFHYQNANQPAPPLHSHNLNQLNQQNAQIWVPHQPPGHYHPQQLQKPESQTHYSNKSSQPAKLRELERKKSSGNNNQQLRSPSAKRPTEAPVTIQGWLHKQGSDGLMLWKKRWFVLSEYCLFYYKGPEEEKLLGSILLPSYRVSVCGPDDKVNRKYAFKCEHANMRTYILAADSQELMMQWVRLLNMACLLQNTNETERQLSQSPATSNPSAESPNMRQQQPAQSQNLRNTPIHMHSSSNTTDLSNPSQQELSQYSQPLYANAPPKPRRLTDGYSSPSSEVLDRYSGESKYVTLQQPHQYNIQPLYGTRGVAKSPINVYGNPQLHPEYLQGSIQQQIYNKHLHIPEYGVAPVRDNHNVERRTPDTYGRSKLNPPKGTHPSDYEDVYADQSMYKRPLSPMAYTNNNRLNPTLSVPAARPYTPITMRGPKDNLPYIPLQQLQKIPNTIPRPHSADFLEYEVKHQNSNVIARQPRPKSSLDINRHTSNDNYFYTEERYAEKMRKSAQYLPKMSKYPCSQNEYPTSQQKWPTTFNKCEADDNTFPLTRSNSRPINFNDSNLQDFCQRDLQPVRSRSVLSDGSLSKEVEMDLYSHEHFDKGTISPAFRSRQEQIYGYNDDLRKSSREYDQFTRSASARLAHNSGQFEGRLVNREGERKREESMKRLLEWKQRMLQSPLNRKVNQGMHKGPGGKFNPYYRTSENGYPQIPNLEVYPDTRRSTNALPQYNSYSSDDEENEDGSKENVQTQAGRTTDTYPSISKPHIPALTASTTVFNSPPMPDESLISSDTMHDVARHSNAVKKLPVVCTRLTEKNTSRGELVEINQEGDIFEKPLKVATNNSTHTAFVSSLRSEFSNKFEKSPTITEIKSNGALVKNILAEFEKKMDTQGTCDANTFQREISVMHDSSLTPTKDIESIIEENYMTMTPKKSVLDPSNSHSILAMIVNTEVDENPYVEMTQGSDISLLEANNDNSICVKELQAYETVCFTDGKIEPVYVELNQLISTNESLKNVFDTSRNSSKPELPDILIPSQNKNKNCSSNKSDSSDADDEASKDLDSLDTPCHPRFSLSDTFRPASYYLGASRVAPELQDSSDSELVSPPPIPTSPPPLDDLDNTDECVSSSQDVSLTEQETKDDIYRYNLQSHRNSEFFKQTVTGNSTPALDSKKPIILSLNSLIDQDNSSLYSDTDRRYSSRLSQNSDSDIELRTPLSRTSDYERMLKRRPVSEEFYDELESLASRPHETIDSFDLDRHLKQLEASNIIPLLYDRSSINKEVTKCDLSRPAENYHDYENMYVTGQLEKEVKMLKDNSDSQGSTFVLSNTTTLSPLTTHTHSRDNSRDTVSSQLTVNTYKSDSSSRRSTFSPNDFILRARPESTTSIIAEVSGFLSISSPRLTPAIRTGSSMSIQEINSASFFFSGSKPKQASLNSFSNQPAPYYYSDLSINTSRTDSNSSILTLNNQRSAMNGSKKDITHIVNPIRCNNRTRNSLHSPHRNLFDATCKLAAEARSASVDFLNIADKSGNIDKKNIYESDTLKRLKARDSSFSLQSKSEVRNLYPRSKRDKFNRNDASTSDPNVRRSYSLEGLLENVLHESIPMSQEFNGFSGHIDSSTTDNTTINASAEGSHLWEEDSIWHERLRSASQRHTRSMDDLDCIREPEKKPKKQARGITRLVTYVNDNMFNMPIQDKEQMELESNKEESNKSETKEASSFTIDREKLRQWDFLSSAPSGAQLFTQSPAQGCINSVVDLGAGVSACEPSEQNGVQHPASGSISITTRDTFPRSVPAKKTWTPTTKPAQSKSTTNLARCFENEYTISRRPQQGYFISQGVSQHDLSSDTSQSSNSRRANWQLGEKMNVSAGELLGRTHEELVLLLIQLRRQSANNCNAIEACYNEIDSIQSNLPKMDASKRLENLQKLEQIKQHLLELEKQYEKGKPLVNLVDNMVKLGSLYRFPKDHNNYPYVKDRLEFNQQIQERRLLAEERRDWSRLSPNHTELQAKVQQLYQLDRLIQEESETLQGLQQDKEEIERALGGLRHRLIKGFKDPAEVEQARKQQIILENELSRVHSMLAQNSRKLEETVAGNARLEQELLVLKQKLQISRQQRSSPQISNAGDSLPCVIGTSAMLESDLHRVQQKVGDLQRQRQELSMQVRQLTDRSNNLQQSRPSSVMPPQIIQGNKKKMNSLWRETDLDTMTSVDHGDSWDNSAASPIPVTPLYINTNVKPNQESDIYNRNFKSSDSASDDTLQNQNITPQEKQEIKTVRIVKRESERRQRDREKTSTGKWDTVVEEEDLGQNSSVLFRVASVQKTQSSTNLEMMSPNNSEPDKSSNGVLSRQSSLSIPSLPQGYSDGRTVSTASVEGSLEKSPQMSPIFKSEAARQIIIEMSTQDSPKQTNRRAVPKEKRRHYTAPHNNLIMKSLNQLPTDDKDFDKLDINIRRARDDLDMERALRQRIDAPDVVRSTLSNKELKYNESTIDNILGTPNKIFIPERYVPEQLPQLSAEEQQHRLRKVESIKKMLSDTTIISGSSANLASDETNSENTSSSITSKATSKMIEEKKQREHLLQLNQILAKQVMEMSKIVAVKALASLPLEPERLSSDEEDLSPDTPLPIYQQRDNFYS